ncbi:uncharacterized protein LOC115888180 [Sitophilus oryzae]|uniref:Uncharacterized protein LOC115888180 n=1 Tax=Sitophilus oryzae TaxID=7048 RepID=A0A6J2YK50_SITOR|nr:uncharacterized protein LOC115888180 [Sitophilus oryzae]
MPFKTYDKMLMKFTWCVTVFCIFCVGYSGVSGNDYENNHIGRGLDARNLLTSIASNLMSRGFGTTGSGSQVVSLNLTNLLILILLKAIIFGAASLGSGHLKGGYGRSADGEEKFITDEEVLMFLSYLTGSPGDNGCLQSIACQQPYQAKKYVNAGDVLLKTAKMFSMNTDDNYDYVLKEVEQASNVGLAGGNCQTYRCSTTGNR